MTETPELAPDRAPAFRGARSPPRILFALPVALSAFLLFLVQPIVARSILTWFGGGPAVWTTCLLFFQTVLLVGYAYAHALASRPPRIRWLVHGALLAASLAFLPIAPSETWKPAGAESPLLGILLVLGATIGLPYFALSATSPLFQRVAGEARPGRDPYRLAALSNGASLLALVSYPFAVEPFLALRTQQQVWSVAFAATATLMVIALWVARATAVVRADGEATDLPPAATNLPLAARAAGSEPAEVGGAASWLGLSIFPSMLLAATTNELCLEVAAVPFLWILPLAIYLSTFVIAFERPAFYRRSVFAIPVLGCVLGIAVLHVARDALALPWQIAAYSVALFIPCMACHGELAQQKPGLSRLTDFHLTIALGGALGAGFVAVAAPILFTRFLELHVAIAGCAIVLFVTWLASRRPVLFSRDWFSGDRRVDRIALGVWAAAAAMALITDIRATREDVIYAHRDFYGAAAVIRAEADDPRDSFDLLRHGRIQHGLQFVASDRRGEITSYYCERSGLWLAMGNHARRLRGEPLRIGVLGLGIGTVAMFGMPGDVVRFYELSPSVARIASERFTFLEASAATVEVVLGDARLSLERELAAGQRQRFDLLVMDAFASESIPRHLVTREAFALYREHLADGGMIAANVSNLYLDIDPLVLVLAREAGMEAGLVYYQPEPGESACVPNTWVLATADRSFFELPAVKERLTPWPPGSSDFTPWTDDFGGLLSVLKW